MKRFITKLFFLLIFLYSTPAVPHGAFGMPTVPTPPALVTKVEASVNQALRFTYGKAEAFKKLLKTWVQQPASDALNAAKKEARKVKEVAKTPISKLAKAAPTTVAKAKGAAAGAMTTLITIAVCAVVGGELVTYVSELTVSVLTAQMLWDTSKEMHATLLQAKKAGAGIQLAKRMNQLGAVIKKMVPHGAKMPEVRTTIKMPKSWQKGKMNAKQFIAFLKKAASTGQRAIESSAKHAQSAHKHLRDKHPQAMAAVEGFAEGANTTLTLSYLGGFVQIGPEVFPICQGIKSAGNITGASSRLASNAIELRGSATAGGKAVALSNAGIEAAGLVLGWEGPYSTTEVQKTVFDLNSTMQELSKKIQSAK
ncbi:MAG: hypothetical protein ACPGUZ_00500 [Holosporaceae bacterium]